MTRADIELMLTNLAETTKYLRVSSQRMREAAEHIVAVADHLQEIGTRTDAAITAGLTHLHGDEETDANG
jgi:hypothetical protein